MSKIANIEQQLNERYEQVSAEAKAKLEKLEASLRDAYAKLESKANLEKLEASLRDAYAKLEATANELLANLKGEKEEPKKGAKKAEPTQIDEIRTKVAGALGLPTRDEVEALNKKLASLTRKVNKLAKEAK